MTPNNPQKYKYSDKPLEHRYGKVYEGNLLCDEDKNNDPVKMFTTGLEQSFFGYSGAPEYEAFPLRQIFSNTHKQIPSEWDTGYISTKDSYEYISKNKKYLVAAHYGKDKTIRKCFLYLGGKECIYVYIYDRVYDILKDHFAVGLLFKYKSKRVENLMDYFIKLVIPVIEKKENYLNVLVRDHAGFGLLKKEIVCPEIDFDINYNEDFTPINKLIIEKLSVENSKGLVLLHGLPGTGKTTYIRYLINNLKKRIIYIPPTLTNVIADPELIKFFIIYSNSILVIEDAENVLMKRNSNSSQAIANILNLSDGLLSDCTNIQIVATFNTELLNIDTALLRKGRLITKYEFKQLDEKRALKLSKKLGVKIDGKHTLADIYNASDKSFTKKTRKIGFK